MQPLLELPSPSFNRNKEARNATAKINVSPSSGTNPRPDQVGGTVGSSARLSAPRLLVTNAAKRQRAILPAQQRRTSSRCVEATHRDMAKAAAVTLLSGMIGAAPIATAPE